MRLFVKINGFNDYVNGQGFCCADKSNIMRAGAIGNGADNPEKLQYYYHSDHLGSTSLITDLDGNVVQHVEYVPFGEVFIEERNNTWNTPYKFNAKELDEETGLYYYGERYYDPRASIWLGMDREWEKHPNINVYCYAALNPVKFIDPNGKDFRLNVYHDKQGKWHIDISTTVYVTGKDAADKVKDYNDFIAKNSSKLQGNYQENGTNYAISLNIEYKEGDSKTADNLDKKRKAGKTTGDNILNILDEPDFRSIAPQGGYLGQLGSSEYYSSPEVAFHELLHLFGFDDRYVDIDGVSVSDFGFSNDILGAIIKDWEFQQVHFDDLGAKSLKIWNDRKLKKETGIKPGLIDSPFHGVNQLINIAQKSIIP